MSFKVLVFVVTTWIVMSFLCGVVEGALLSGDIGTTKSTLNTLMHSNFASPSFWSALGGMVTFHFPALFTGTYAILQWVFFLPLALAFGIMMAGYIMAHIPIIGRGT